MRQPVALVLVACALVGLLFIGLTPRGIRFTDEHLELAIRQELGISAGPIRQSDVAGIVQLRMEYSPVRELGGIEKLTNLESLYINGNSTEGGSPLTDLRPLSGLRKLRELSITNCHVDDIQPLAEMTALSEVVLMATRVSDIARLGELPNLRYLDLNHCRVVDLSPLADHPALEILALYGNEVDDLASLSTLTHLRNLNLGAMDDLDLAPLSGLVNLEDLLLGTTYDDTIYHFENYSALGELANLRYLALLDCDIEDIAFVERLASLRVVRLSGSTITDLSPLDLLPQLERLEIDRCPLDLTEGSETTHLIEVLQARGVEITL